MSVPDARARSKISLSPSKVLTTSWALPLTPRWQPHDSDLNVYRLPNRLITRLTLSNLLFSFSLYAGKEWLLKYDVGVFWLVMRLLACGGLGVIVWELFTGQLTARKSAEVC